MWFRIIFFQQASTDDKYFLPLNIDSNRLNLYAEKSSDFLGKSNDVYPAAFHFLTRYNWIQNNFYAHFPRITSWYFAENANTCVYDVLQCYTFFLFALKYLGLYCKWLNEMSYCMKLYYVSRINEWMLLLNVFIKPKPKNEAQTTRNETKLKLITFYINQTVQTR